MGHALSSRQLSLALAAATAAVLAIMGIAGIALAAPGLALGCVAAYVAGAICCTSRHGLNHAGVQTTKGKP